jgi:hypothetical protein
MMMRLVKLSLAAAAVGLTANTASAAITAFWQPVPITATTDAQTPAPGLADFQSFDLMITLSALDDFTSFRLLFDPAGPIFQHANGEGGPNFGPPNSALVPFFPALAFDSYMRGPGNSVTVVGSTDGTNDLPPPGIFDSNRLAIAAGDLTLNPGPGTFQLLRATFQGAPPTIEGGTLLGRVFSVQDQVGFVIPNIPEPTTLGLVAAVGLLAARRRRA